MEVVSVDYKEINDYLVGIFNNVLIIEEASLKTSRFSDVSIKEMHTIDQIGNTPNATPSDIAKALMVTLGTVTTSLNKLEQKGYIIRTRSNVDRRVVHLTLSQKGRLLYRLHQKFHMNMVKKITDGLDDDEFRVMERGLKNLNQFLEDLK
nr:MarR family transcriptional regulator [Streptococcus hyovaginalis]